MLAVTKPLAGPVTGGDYTRVYRAPEGQQDDVARYSQILAIVNFSTNLHKSTRILRNLFGFEKAMRVRIEPLRRGESENQTPRDSVSPW
jgi:hypothetical protein